MIPARFGSKGGGKRPIHARTRIVVINFTFFHNRYIRGEEKTTGANPNAVHLSINDRIDTEALKHKRSN
jgi:hypothetical protein